MELISWQFPLVLWLLLVPVLGWLLRIFYQKKHQLNYGEQEFWPWIMRQKSTPTHPNWLLVLAWILIVLALANPRIEQQLPKIDQRTEVDLLVVLDSSRSMSAEDLSPNRFVQAQNFIESLTNRLTPDDRIGLMTYSSTAHWVSPLSFDKSLLKRNLYLLQPDILPYAGSQPAKALSFALEEVSKYRQAPSVILLVADSLTGLDAELLAQDLEQQNTQLWLVSLGKTSPTYLRDAEHPSGFMHWDNKRVDVALDKASFDKFATQAGGVHFHLDSSASQLQQMQNKLKEVAASREITKYEQHFTSYALYLLFAGVLLLFWQFNLNIRVISSFAGTGVFVVILTFQPVEKSFASSYLEALEEAKLLYKEADFAEASWAFREALLTAQDDSEKAEALFNLGLSFSQLKHWALAVETLQAYELYQPATQEVQEALALAEAELAKLKEITPLPVQTAKPRHDLEDAFHGGQKVSEEISDDEWGAQEVKEREQEFVAPEELVEQEKLGSLAGLSATKSTEDFATSYQATREVEELLRQLNQLEDAQQDLLKHIFEREAGFQARQEKTHQMEGVLPW